MTKVPTVPSRRVDYEKIPRGAFAHALYVDWVEIWSLTFLPKCTITLWKFYQISFVEITSVFVRKKNKMKIYIYYCEGVTVAYMYTLYVISQQHLGRVRIHSVLTQKIFQNLPMNINIADLLQNLHTCLWMQLE